MSLTGILLDVSASIMDNIESETDEPGEPRARSIFKVIDYFIKHDVSFEGRVFAIGVGGNCASGIFDFIGSIQHIEDMKMPSYRKNMPATEDHINEILDILQKNGARKIRKWAEDITLIQDIVSDHMAALILRRLKSDEQFLGKFVDEFLPSACQDRFKQSRHTTSHRPHSTQTNSLETYFNMSSFLHSFVFFGRPATSEDIYEVVEKAKCDFLRDVDTHSIFSVQDASRIIRGKELNELSTKRKQELLENIEPFIYGRTPLYESLEKATKLFEAEGATCNNKLLFVISDGEPTDGGNDDSAKINQITSKLRKAGVKIVSCFISRSTDIHPKRLYDEIQLSWEPGAKFLFSLSSEVSTQCLPQAILVERGWTIDIANNKTKLFMQVNNLREACEMARDVVCCPNVRCELLASLGLDIYINQIMGGFKANEQDRGTCYANASAAVLHLAMRRILGRENGYPDFHELKNEMIKAYGSDGADTRKVLQKICPKYRLRSQIVCINGAKEAVAKKRPVVARFRLTHDEWKAFSRFYKTNPMGILTQNELDVRKRPTSPPPDTSGHAVVLTSYNSSCLTFMNSWGQKWGDNGFFRIQNAEVLQLELFDVYWTLNDLTEGEKEYYRKYGSDVATMLMNLLEALQKSVYTFPKCSEQTSSSSEFAGTLSKFQCPKCLHDFSTDDNAGNIVALNRHLISLSG